MGLPAGHVTGHGLRAAQELKMLGNGVVPQQAALALRMLGLGGDAVAAPAVDSAMIPTPRGQDEYERRNMKTMVKIRDHGGDMTLPTWAKVVVPLIGQQPDVDPDDLFGGQS